MPKILLVEDDPQISKSLSMSLGFSGFDVTTADNMAGGWSHFNQGGYDLLILDVNLPDGNGVELCQRIRSSGDEVPILFLSAATSEESVVKGMTAGGDDYIRKPFGSEELKVRLQRLLQKSQSGRKVLEAGPLRIDVEKRTAVLNEKTLSLGKREFEILMLLAKRAGDVITREQILSHLDEKPEVYDRTVDSHISHLRRKIREAAGERLQINAVYGVGYRLQWEKVAAQ